MKKILFVLIDGVADKGASTLEAAEIPNLDKLAKNGNAGLVDNQLSEHPDSTISAWLIYGYPLLDYPGRGILEAIGSGIKPEKGNIYFRGNFATVKEIAGQKETYTKPNLVVVDRRAGRETNGLTELARGLSRLYIEGISIEVHHTHGHRAVLVLEGKELSAEVSSCDPGETGKKIKEIKALAKTNKAMHTASVLNKFGYKSYKFMQESMINKKRVNPANYLLLRGASMYNPIKSFEDKYGLKAACVAVSECERGIAKLAGFDVAVLKKSCTGDTKTDLVEKVNVSLKTLKDKDFVLLHIKGTDICSHDKDFNGKKGFVEKIDREVIGPLLERLNFEETVLVVSSDHVTDVHTGMHEAGKFPFAVYTSGIKRNNVKAYDENSCRLGPIITPDEFMEKVMNFG
ncbi:MAG: 2,3-bisphosphoglycerate-independent phosphoglycerate mutase [Candidatus Aenigmarchaeota archaeon]|nr:2,3-bisphosphoglycerate-independent phosphoglycerate mutase [Candidatus Aenigmarchaeota archaeon]